MQKKYAVLTIDVESFKDTECIANASEDVDCDLLDGFDEYIDLLDKHDIKATLFTVATLAPKIIDKLKPCIKNGHELALHSYSHIAPLDINCDIFESNILKAKEELTEIFGAEIRGFRAPFFSIDCDRLSTLKKLGFRYDSSFLNFPKARHTVKFELQNFKEISKNIYQNGDFFEFGLSSYKSLGISYPISGGGYVRLSNWTFIKSLIKQYLQKNNFYVFYLHPFELTRQKIPVLKDLKLYDKFYLTHGIASYRKRIEQLIIMLKKLGYEFITFDELSEKILTGSIAF